MGVLKGRFFFLLSTTMLFGSSAVADVNLFTSDTGYKVDLGGESYFEFGSRGQAKKYEKYPVTNDNSDFAFYSNTAVHFSVYKDHQNGWQSGIQLGMRATNNTRNPIGKHLLDRTYFWTENDKYGILEVGSNVSASNAMMIDADIFGGWEGFVSLDTNGGVNEDNFLTSPKLVLKEKDWDTQTHERSRKITYYTPKYHGFQYGISFIPDVWNNGGVVAMPQRADSHNYYGPNRREHDAVASGLSWEHEFDKNQSIEVAVVGEIARINRSSIDKYAGRSYYNSAAASVGVTYTYDKASFTAAYGNHWKTRVQKSVQNVPYAYFVNVGANYQYTEELNLSSAVFYSEQYGNPMMVAGVSSEYKVAPGLLPYANIVFFQMWQRNNYSNPSYYSSTPTSASLTSSHASNNGVALILGTKLRF